MKKAVTLYFVLLSAGLAAQKAAVFNGTDGRVTVDSTSFSLTGLSGLTFASWINADLIENNKYIFDFSDSAGFAAGTNGMRFMVLNTYNNLQRRSNLGFYFYFNQNNPPVVNGNATGFSNQWVHMAAVIDRTSDVGTTSNYDVIVYINGIESARGTRAITNADPSVRALHLSPFSQLKLAARYDNRNTSHLTGSLDDFIVYNRALSPAELKEIVCQGALPASGRILYYAFEENRGTLAIDSTATAANGTFSSGASWGAGIAGGIGSTPPAVGYSYNTNSPSLTVAFNDTSLGNNPRVWYFGDGDSSLLRNPTHIYAAQGKYNVCLKLTNSCGVSAQACKEVNVVCPPAAASYIKTVTDKKVVFEADTNGGTMFTWDFGDGSALISGADKGMVTKIFSDYKNYRVCLYVESPCGMDTICETVYIAVTGERESAISDDIKLFPNPAAHMLNVAIRGSSSPNVRIIDLTGKEVLDWQPLQNDGKINISHLVPGQYVIEIMSEGQTLRKPFGVY
jgi:PKD repeat protein